MSTSANPQMSPERSPGSISPGAGVRRANKLPLYLGIGLIAVVALVVAMVANDRAEKQARMLQSTSGSSQQGRGGGTLAQAGALQIFSDFPGAKLAGHWYGAALANALAGEDLAPGGPDPGPLVRGQGLPITAEDVAALEQMLLDSGKSPL